MILTSYQKRVLLSRKKGAKKKLLNSMSSKGGKWSSPSRHAWRYFHDDNFEREDSDGAVKQEGDDLVIIDRCMATNNKQPTAMNWWRIVGESLFFGKFEHHRDSFQVAGDFDGERPVGYVRKSFLRVANYHPKLEFLKTVGGKVCVRVSRFHSFSLFVKRLDDFPPHHKQTTFRKNRTIFNTIDEEEKEVLLFEIDKGEERDQSLAAEHEKSLKEEEIQLKWTAWWHAGLSIIR